ncbi:hypothetical protein P879_03857 [Paragonimus westermani]|uniref:Uncharacterized protein n=1 Tax=Paragonimus westermani TaxID=34504 RepID=A0A8T0DLL6_9TREM|nr:hypothetical protein P879_03857 [Paragonimus westermani]
MSWQMPQYGSHRQHPSLGSLGDYYQTSHPVPDDLPTDEHWCLKGLQLREGVLVANAQICCVDASASTTSTFMHSGCTLVSEDDSLHVVAHSGGTGSDCDIIPWQSRPCPHSWPEDVDLTKSVNLAAVRRSVSCVTDAKSFTGRQQSLDPRVVATLPARRECELPRQTQTAPDAVVLPVATGMVLSTAATTSIYSNSSSTATLSTVTLTTGSFPSISISPFGPTRTVWPSFTATSSSSTPLTLTGEHKALRI